uniref:Anaphase-promoting complex subunit 4 WD40 domain-containing protein n=1 Tax=Polytomella parva TaxID=51329 RepID=A0A7S0URN5_9CHLO|mmetsp:Transcript_19134/g.34628  ORF Transcript_19134/g.34628 Transcript_19134/m.34628 type:complete len:474 (+) Transcript_19134:265-1686(+)|eukprot:CAMPEP_0175047894 /NCGR_PEP_ID=MMETSP0052_2-20121109/5865_1 /TAXON_ID=51329 ORGANISM="Polytomella parva, Strain SAG 63-3" /NCGR_SAMPLE_ID=MMETSP0052_2 /ASSEMBLY_ACC=CAM_ASM_000194 /LENGTH=473 /DNA_ID=CAMNT_0016311853 /DNA_START=218 /DNA_END=1639 /DNA_ORIENTATION=-
MAKNGAIIKALESENELLREKARSAEETKLNLEKTIAAYQETIQYLETRVRNLIFDIDILSAEDYKKTMELHELRLNQVARSNGIPEAQTKIVTNTIECEKQVIALQKELEPQSRTLEPEVGANAIMERESGIDKNMLKLLQPCSTGLRKDVSPYVLAEVPLTDELTQKSIITTGRCRHHYCMDISKYNIMAVAHDFFTVYLYSEISKVKEKLFEVKDKINAVVWNNAGTLLAVGFDSRNVPIQVWDVLSRKLFKLLPYHSDAICYSLTWSGDIISCGTQQYVFHWDMSEEKDNQSDHTNSDGVKRQEPTTILRNKYFGNIGCVTWSFCRSKFGILNFGGHMCIYDANSKLIQYMKAHPNDGNNLRWCPWDNDILATCSDTGQIKVWNVNYPTPVKEVMNSSSVRSLQWIPSIKAIASADLNNDIILWEYPSLKQIATLKGHTKYAHNIHVNMETSALVSRSHSEIIFWKPFK